MGGGSCPVRRFGLTACIGRCHITKVGQDCLTMRFVAMEGSAELSHILSVGAVCPITSSDSRGSFFARYRILMAGVGCQISRSAETLLHGLGFLLHACSSFLFHGFILQPEKASRISFAPVM